MIEETGIEIEEGDTVDIGFNSTFTIYEHTAICTMEQGEFNFSSNPTMAGKVEGDGGSEVSLFDSLAKGDLSPYVTTIGLYNSAGEMVAIAKVPRPIKRAPELDQTVIVKFDI